MRIAHNFINLAGKRFDKLIVIGIHSRKGQIIWRCVCDCGGSINRSGTNLKSRSSQHCGCVKHVPKNKHGLVGTSEYNSWASMLSRCRNPNNQDYKNYGGKGIGVSAEWLNFLAFYRDMGTKPTRLHSIDRIDNSKGYSKENCRWATKKEQANNRTSNIIITAYGETKTIGEWATTKNMRLRTIWARLGAGKSGEDCVTNVSELTGKRLNVAKKY